ncbi:MAG TPA: MFS transporter [Methanomicrobiales archaeon]|nr:MFS transporter [Methanomicrobiales archaeon]
MASTSAASTVSARNLALQVIMLLGVVALFGDVVYEGARSVTGPYILLLGGSAVVVGVVAGIGEFFGYGIRLASGYLADKTHRYWGITIAGYAMLISVPLLAFAGSWELAALLIVLERVGKGIRSPAKDALLSHASRGVGRGWGFAIHEALDQVGAIAGPLVFTFTILAGGSGIGDYRFGFLLLAVPLAILLAVLLYTREAIPNPVGFEEAIAAESPHEERGIPSVFLPYAVFTGLSMLGFATFPILAYHWKLHAIIPDAEIPLLFAVAMGVDAVMALIAGRTYDKKGLSILLILPFISILVPIFAFAFSYNLVIVGAVLWGAAMGIQETVLRAAIADYTHIRKRGTAYGIFNTVYGGAWFIGSVVLGLLYEIRIEYILVFVGIAELAALIAFFWMRREVQNCSKCGMDA